MSEPADDVSRRWQHVFWTQFLLYFNTKTSLFAHIHPTANNYLGTGIGSSTTLEAYITLDNASVLICTNHRSAARSKAVFDALVLHKNEIEKAFGDKLQWNRCEGRLHTTIEATVYEGDLRNRNKWPDVNKMLADHLIRLEQAIRPCFAGTAMP